ncbi:MAG: RIP metalloprotease RseP [Gemmatimonadota bacterium]|nr:RIP metalloprotease RseP [Gemmatimonadota bacterium]
MLLTVAVTILVLGVLIFVHELGHFAAAKSVDIEVPRFSIGLGPKMFGFRRGETEYVISWIPLGGYVKMAGMADEEVTSKLEGPDGGVSGDSLELGPRDFDAKPLWARTLVIVAGVIMNWVFAIVAFTAIAMGEGVVEPRITTVSPDTPADSAGLMAGDLITRIDGQSVRDPLQVILLIERKPNEEVRLTVDRDGESLLIRATPAAEEQFNEIAQESRTVGRVGIEIGPDRYQLGLGRAFAHGWGSTVYWSRAVIQFLGDFVTRKASPREVGGPIMIGQISGQAARAGPWRLLSFMAIISINLAVFNLLPIPVLDGGHLVFLAVEGIQGRPVSVNTRLRFTTVGMVFVVGLMLWAVGNDFLRILGI